MNVKVSNYNIIKNLQGPNNIKYKTQLCKHFNTPQGCSYGDKCQFAHGQQELKQVDGNMIQQNFINMNNKQKDALNYKIVKCKNWEKDKTCKYGAHCTFAHGDSEIRHKTDNLAQMQSNMGMGGFGFFMNPMMMDMNQMMQMNPQMQGMPMIPIDAGQFQMMNIGNMGMPPMMNNNVPQDMNKNDEAKNE